MAKKWFEHSHCGQQLRMAIGAGSWLGDCAGPCTILTGAPVHRATRLRLHQEALRSLRKAGPPPPRSVSYGTSWNHTPSSPLQLRVRGA